jgi:hypothetical protein
MFYHSLVSDWNHGNAHFLRGVVSELLDRDHDVRIFEPRDGWAGTTVTLLNVSSGLEISLSWTTGYGNFPPPLWKP